MWADTLLLMRHYWKLDRREYSRVRGWKLVGYVAAIIAFLFVGAFSAAIGYGASFLLRPDMPVRVGPGVFPGVLLTFVLLGVLITGLNQAVRALFLSGDLERLVGRIADRTATTNRMLTLPGSRLSSLATMTERVCTGATTSRSRSPLRNSPRTA